MTGNKTVQQALDDAAEEWDLITERLGRENQKEYYKALMEDMNLWKELPG